MQIKYRKPRLTSEQKLQLVSDYKAGKPIKEIAERFNIHRVTIYRILKQDIKLWKV